MGTFSKTLITTAALIFLQSCSDDGIQNTGEEKWSNLPPSGKYSPNIIEIPAKRYSPSRHVNMFTLIKTDNYIQHHNGEMEFVNYHRYGEIFVYPRENLKNATLVRIGDDRAPDVQFEIRQDYRSFFFEGGYFASLEHMDEEVPGEEYRFDMTYDDGREMSHTVTIPAGKAPGPVKMHLFQDDVEISYTEINPDKDLHVRWSGFDAAADDPNDILDDVVTISLNTCGDNFKRLYVSGEPTLNEPYLTHNSKEAIIPSSAITNNSWFWLEGEFSDIVETSKFDNAPSQSTYLNSVLLAVRTHDGPEQSNCTESMPRF